MNIYISSSWKNRERVRQVVLMLRSIGHEVYDFTDGDRRKTPEIPPEKFPDQFDPAKHNYSEYLSKSGWRNAVEENKMAIASADLIVLLLPCGSDSHADWAYGVGLGKKTVVIGHPNAGDRSPVHLWADAILHNEWELVAWLTQLKSEMTAKERGACYVARMPGNKGYHSICLDRPEYRVDTAKFVYKSILEGAIVERVSVEVARAGMEEYMEDKRNTMVELNVQGGESNG